MAKKITKSKKIRNPSWKEEAAALGFNNLAQAVEAVKLRCAQENALRTRIAQLEQETPRLRNALARAETSNWLIQYMIRDYALALERMGVALCINHPFVTFKTGGGEIHAHVKDILHQGIHTYIELCRKLPRCVGDPHPTFNGVLLDLEALAEGQPQPCACAKWTPLEHGSFEVRLTRAAPAKQADPGAKTS